MDYKIDRYITNRYTGESRLTTDYFGFTVNDVQLRPPYDWASSRSSNKSEWVFEHSRRYPSKTISSGKGAGLRSIYEELDAYIINYMITTNATDEIYFNLQIAINESVDVIITEFNDETIVIEIDGHEKELYRSEQNQIREVDD